MSRDEDWVIRPEGFLRYLREVEGLSYAEVRLPPRGILIFGGYDLGLFTRLLRGQGFRWNASYVRGLAGRTPIGVSRTTMGAPSAVVSLEEAVALGMRRIVVFGACGSLRRDLPIGTVVLPTRAYSEEGTSRHYGGSRWSRPDPHLVRALRTACERRGVPFVEGATWTTDAPYRESRAKVRSLGRRGVVGVEMEASALFRVARVRGVRIASLFVVSDELDGPEWNAGFRDPRFRAAKESAAEAVIHALRRPLR